MTEKKFNICAKFTSAIMKGCDRNDTIYDTIINSIDAPNIYGAYIKYHRCGRGNHIWRRNRMYAYYCMDS